jgi:MoaA/NifB/PqqE/SkfB family radical SAM enzyme
LQAYLFGKRYHFSVTFLATYRCNFSCPYCAIPGFSGAEMDTAQVKRMIDEFAACGTRRFSFNGGEPLLRPDIEELTAYCRKKNLFTTIFTNGWLVEQNLGAIKNLNLLIVTLDGPEAVHDSQRNKPGSFRRAVSAIAAARKNGIPVWTNTVLTKNNCREMDFIVRLAGEMRFSMIVQPVLPYSHSASAGEIAALRASQQDHQEAVRFLIRRKKEGAPVAHSFTYLRHILNPDWPANKRKCWAGRLYCAVKPNGEVAPCYPVFHQRPWPNGLETGFCQAFRSSKIEGCQGCYCVIAESDFFYSLYPEAVFNTLNKLPL